MNFYMIDEREIWHRAAIAAAKRHGFNARRIRRGTDVPSGDDGVGFIRPHAVPATLTRNHQDYSEMRRAGLCMVQDAQQMALYEDKWSQTLKWGEFMPPTYLFTDRDAALSMLWRLDYPVVSKAKEGASSLNVRILQDHAATERHIEEVWGDGVTVNCCADGARVTQKGYLILQRFVPHIVTWRVNVVGNAFAIFRRFNYPDRPVAQTGNVEPVMTLTPLTESLLEWSANFFAHADTNWCAIDVLQDNDGEWRLLETSLAWPWPSPGDCMSAPFFGTKRCWAEMFDVMFEGLDSWQN